MWSDDEKLRIKWKKEKKKNRFSSENGFVAAEWHRSTATDTRKYRRKSTEAFYYLCFCLYSFQTLSKSHYVPSMLSNLFQRSTKNSCIFYSFCFVLQRRFPLPLVSCHSAHTLSSDIIKLLFQWSKRTTRNFVKENGMNIFLAFSSSFAPILSSIAVGALRWKRENTSGFNFNFPVFTHAFLVLLHSLPVVIFQFAKNEIFSLLKRVGKKLTEMKWFRAIWETFSLMEAKKNNVAMMTLCQILNLLVKTRKKHIDGKAIVENKAEKSERKPPKRKMSSTKRSEKKVRKIVYVRRIRIQHYSLFCCHFYFYFWEEKKSYSLMTI